MRSIERCLRCGLLLAGFFASVSLSAQSLPPVRPLGPVTHVSPAGVLGSVSAVRPLPDGRVIVNDLTGRKLLLYDRNLTKSTVLAESSAETGRTYGGQFATLVPYRGDSSLFIEPQSLSMTVLDPTGETARVMAIPRPSDAMFLAGGPFGTPAFNSRGHLLYRGLGRVAAASRPSENSSGLTYQQTFADTAPIFRLNLSTRKLDTLAWVRIPTYQMARVRSATGNPTGLNVLTNPIPIVDVWAVTTDGRLAIVRGGDFHVDWINADGQRESTPKMSYPWQRLDDDAKQRIADSTKAAADARGDALRRAFEDNPGTTLPMMDALMRPLGSLVSGNPALRGGQQFIPSRFVMPPLKQLPDYRPAFEVGAALAAPDGSVWVRTTTPSDRGPIYYVINGKGELVDRVKIPFGRVIAGLGAGVVYMGVLDDKGARLEVANVR